MVTTQQLLDETKGMSIEELTQLCFEQLGHQAHGNVPIIIKQSFHKALVNVIIAHKPVVNQDTATFLMMMLNNIVSMVSKIIVTIATLNPKHLKEIGAISNEDQEMLLRRGMEDRLLEVIIDSLKKHILDSHIEYRQFQSGKEDQHHESI